MTIPEESILQKCEEIIAICKEFKADNVRFFGELVGENPLPDCAFQFLVDVQRRTVSNEDFLLLEAKLEKLLGRQVAVSTPDMYIPPILEIKLKEVVHLDVLLNRSTEHLKGTYIDQDIIDKRLEILVLAKRHGMDNVRLIGDIVQDWHTPDSSVSMMVDTDSGSYMGQLDIYYVEFAMERVLGRSVNIYTENMMIPPIRDDYLKDAVAL
jgi:uncharacterized protein